MSRLTLTPLENLESPGAAISHRLTVERSLEPIWDAQARLYLQEMTSEISQLGRVDSSTIHQAYEEIVVGGVMEVVDGEEAGRSAIHAALKSDPLADEVYSSAQVVVEVLDLEEVREVLPVILSFDTPSAVMEALTAAGFEQIARIAGRGALGIAIGAASVGAAPHVTRVIREHGAEWSRRVRGAAITAATAADNAITMAQLETTRGPHGTGYPYKKWITRRDDRVRPTHAAADGQKVPLKSDFTVGGYSLNMPGDPYGPLHERINCRCVVVGARSKKS